MVKRTVRWVRTLHVFPLVLVMTLLAVLWAAGTAWATPPSKPLAQGSTPTMINYQGTIEVGGSPYNGVGYFKFAMVDSSTGNGTTNYWANDGTASGEPGGLVPLQVNGGLFNVLLGDAGMTSLDETAFAHDPTYLRVWFSQTGVAGSYEALEPNQRVVSVAYALRARYAENAPTDHDHWGQGWAGSAFQYGLRLTQNRTGPANYGLYARNNSTGVAVRGSANIGYGVYGSTSGLDHAGVYGSATASNGYGVYGRASGSSGRGVYGTGYYGVYGSSSSINGRGVYGLASRSSGTNWGVQGQSNSTSGVGVLGANYTSSGSTYGVYGYTQSGGGHAVHGWSFSGSGYAGYFQGRVRVVGNLSKSSGSFQIDHPLDAENKYLYHSFVESPDMMNIYNGNITLDANGEAWVALPDWFEALNQEFRYQLTPIGAPGPNLYVAEQIQANRFKIAGGEPGLVVSWQVTGIRHDPYAEAHRIPVEETKPPEEQGTYLHPVEHGQPETMGLDYQRNQGLRLSLSEAELEEPEAFLPEEIE